MHVPERRYTWRGGGREESGEQGSIGRTFITSNHTCTGAQVIWKGGGRRGGEVEGKGGKWIEPHRNTAHLEGRIGTKGGEVTT